MQKNTLGFKIEGMDFQEFVDSYSMAAAVLSVEKLGEEHWGEIRIVKANAMYKKIMGSNYKDGMRYDELVQKEANFEDFCYRCAVKKLHLHAYVDTKSMGVWTDGTYIPLSSEFDTDKLSYFVFFFEFTKAPEAERLSDMSMEAAPFIIQTCINLRKAENFIEAMNTAIADIQIKTDSFCSAIFMIDTEKQKYAPLCAKYRNDEATIEDFLPYLSNEVVFSWVDMIKNKDAVFVKDSFDMQEIQKINPVWAKSLIDGGVKSVILVPLLNRNKLIGVLFVTNFNTEKFVEIKEFITLTAFFLSAEIANNNLMERLEFMSNIDSLTGVKNRNSMNTRVEWNTNGLMPVHLPYGIIFADLNGLKICNDTKGHKAGDELLKKAAALLKEIFNEDEIYRSGGDEFVIISTECSKDDFETKIEELRKKSSYGNEVCFAFGSRWTDTEEDLRESMQLADKAMYEDKRKYYEAHPEFKTRHE